MTKVRDFGDEWTWRKSSRSGDNGGECVFAAVMGSSTVGVRDSKLGQGGPVIRMTRDDWASLAQAVSR